MKLSFLTMFLLLPSFVFSATLKIESHPVLGSILKEMNVLGSSPELYPVTENYRLDLTLTDLIDQTTIILQDRPELNERLTKVLNKHEGFPDFLSWFNELKLIALEYPEIKTKIDLGLYMQFYAPSGIALLPDYKTFDFRKIKQRAKIQRIKTYNKYAGDPEGQGLLMAFAKKEWKKGFYTKPLTVSKLKAIQHQELRIIHEAYYHELIKLYVKHDPAVTFIKSRSGIRAQGKKLFNIIQELPTKHQILFSLSQKVSGLTFDSGFIILTPSFIESHYAEIKSALQDITLDQILHSEDDQYILSLRNFIQNNSVQIENDLAVYNSINSTKHELYWKNRHTKPGRLEAIANIESLLLLYPDSPWFKGTHGTIIDRSGKQIYLNETIRRKLGRIFLGLRKKVFLSENYLSFLAGGIVFTLSEGNLPVAMTARNLVRNAIRTSKYDREWNDFLKDVPYEVINAMLLGAGGGPGRFFNIVALGAGRGFLQSFVTGQDLRTGALVGAGLSIIQYYVLPTSWARPMTSGYDARALIMNRRLELLEGSIRGFVQGATVAAIEGENITVGALKGSAFGFISTQMVIWFLGTRYNPFKGWTDGEVDQMIGLENDFQNSIGRGGEYAIDRQLIMDANFRVGGVLPRSIGYSVTLPGNVTMNSNGFNRLSLLTHEASHLMQHRQTGVFGFYLFRYVPTYFRTGYFGHPDENFLVFVMNLTSKKESV